MKIFLKVNAWNKICLSTLQPESSIQKVTAIYTFLSFAIALGLWVQNFQFKKVWNATVKFWILQKQKWDIMKVSKTEQNHYYLIL